MPDLFNIIINKLVLFSHQYLRIHNRKNGRTIFLIFGNLFLFTVSLLLFNIHIESYSFLVVRYKVISIYLKSYVQRDLDVSPRFSIHMLDCILQCAE